MVWGFKCICIMLLLLKKEKGLHAEILVRKLNIIQACQSIRCMSFKARKCLTFGVMG